jgi:cellobiose phosphorylase
MSSHHGHFSSDGREFVITDPRTPRPWHNYLCSADYLVNITQQGTGASFWQPLHEGLRVNVTEDRDGSGGPRFVYLRENDTGDFWSLTGAPGDGKDLDEWECRVGLGYQIMRSRKNGIEAAWRVFVPEGGDRLELWSVTITNRSDRPRRISAFPYVEMHLTGGSTLMDFIAVLGGHYDPESRAVFGINSCVKFPPQFKAFLASDSEVAGATVSRDEFLGFYRTYANPLAVERGDVHNPQAGTEWIGASLRHEFELAPGASVTFHCALGVIESVDEGREKIARVLAPGEPDRLFAVQSAANDALLARQAVRSGDAQFDRWVNIWLKHQLGFVGKWGRVIGRGFRDILQDSFGHRLTDPARARACLLEVFSKQFPDGRCIRAWRLPNAQLDLQHYADSPSWMIMALAFYLKETGDFSVLDEPVPFLNPQDPYAPSGESATVWDHTVLAQRHLLEHRGRHGLSKIYYGDWCDTMNGVGRRGEGVSVMLSMQVKWGCDLLAELARHLGKTDLASEMDAAAQELACAVEAHAWDEQGGYYTRAFDDDGLVVGSSQGPDSDGGELRIFLNPQSWSVISGISSGDRRESCLQAVRDHLETGYGKVLSFPQSTFLKPRIGQMSIMTPGFYENGSVYTHGNCFWSAALAMAGHGDEAWDAIRTVLPDTPNKPNSDTEPFAIPNMYIGPVVQRRMQRSLYLSGWRTGSAAWLYMTAIEGILGARAEYGGLRIEPHLPSDWDGAQLTRHFRGATYEITIRKPKGLRHGHIAVTLDGQPLDGTLIPAQPPGGTHKVDVTIS